MHRRAAAGVPLASSLEMTPRRAKGRAPPRIDGLRFGFVLLMGGCILLVVILLLLNASIFSSYHSATTHHPPILETSFYIPTLEDADEAFILQQYKDSSRGLSNNVDPQQEEEEDTNAETAVIHIVKTRFMQEQGHLQHLCRARLALFRTVCLPTMAQQTQQNFLWIIKIDPVLHNTTLLRAMIQYTQQFMEYNNTYLVASNVNFRVNEKFPGAWRDGAETHDLLQSRVYTGDRRRLQYAMALHSSSADVAILETRLDADDGLHRQFLATVQATAVETFRGHPHVQWMYWCSRRHVEWHWTDPLLLPSATTQGNQKRSGKPLSPALAALLSDYGTLQGVTHSHLCITPGITTGFAAGTREADVPVFAHDELVKQIQYASEQEIDCGWPSARDCLQFVETFVFEAIRSRSPTSAGMLKIQASPPHDSFWVHYVFWNMVQESFGIRRQELQWMQAYLSEHLLEIASDNLLGQCTTGHSCKESAKKELEQLIAARKALTMQPLSPS